MNRKDFYYRLLVVTGVFLTAACLASTAILDNWLFPLSGAALFAAMAVYGGWCVWLVHDEEMANRRKIEEQEYENPVVRSLATALASSYAKHASWLSDGQSVFVTGYLALAILHTVRKHMAFNCSYFCDLIAEDCSTVLLKIQENQCSPVWLVWEMEPISLQKVLESEDLMAILHDSSTKIISKLKISE